MHLCKATQTLVWAPLCCYGEGALSWKGSVLGRQRSMGLCSAAGPGRLQRVHARGYSRPAGQSRPCLQLPVEPQRVQALHGLGRQDSLVPGLALQLRPQGCPAGPHAPQGAPLQAQGSDGLADVVPLYTNGSAQAQLIKLSASWLAALGT